MVQAVYFASHPLLRHFTFFCFVFETLRLDVALAFVDLAAKFRDAVEPFLNQNLDIDVKREGDDKLVIALSPRENVSGARKTPAKIPRPRDVVP